MIKSSVAVLYYYSSTTVVGQSRNIRHGKDSKPTPDASESEVLAENVTRHKVVAGLVTKARVGYASYFVPYQVLPDHRESGIYLRYKRYLDPVLVLGKQRPRPEEIDRQDHLAGSTIIGKR